MSFVAFMPPQEIAAVGSHDIEKAIPRAGICDFAREPAEGDKHPGMEFLAER